MHRNLNHPSGLSSGGNTGLEDNFHLNNIMNQTNKFEKKESNKFHFEIKSEHEVDYETTPNVEKPKLQPQKVPTTGVTQITIYG